MVIFISPALVTVMVTSLALFVSTILNPSPFMSRFNFVLMMYSMATVAIARISIEEGKERAVLFGMPLAAVTLLAMTTLVQYEDAIGGMKFIYSAVVIAITWWSAHKITWDCTVIEDHDDSSGQGLLQKIGLEDLIAESASNESEGESPAQSSEDESKLTWFERWKENRKKPHTPGVWVIYYSLAALPLFGFGQFLADAATNELCFKYLFLYVASGLGLLLTTSFLGLRRYLRHRDVEMPVEMASTWLSVGALMIAAFMLIALILPRPGNARQLTDVSSWFDQSQDEYETSEYGVGPDGKQDGQEGESTDSPESNSSEGSENPENSEGQSGSDQDDQGQQGENSEQSQQGNTSSGDSNTGGQTDESEMETNGKENSDDTSNQDDSQNNDNENSNQQDDNTGQSQSPQQEDSNQSNDSDQANASNQSNEENQSDNSEGQQGTQNQANNPNDSQENQTSDDNQDSEDNAESNDGNQQSESSESSFQMPEMPSLGILGKLFQILFWIVVGIALIYYLIKNHKALLTALKEMITGFLDWLSSVFAGTQVEPLVEEEVSKTVPLPPVAPFSSFRNPFTSNSQMELNELVQYSFKALESLGYELGITRNDDQTPNEFTQAIANHITPLGQSALRLGRHYSLAAYAPGMLHQSCVEDLKTFWQQLSIVEIRPVTPINEPVSS